jgi:hypothetical protein
MKGCLLFNEATPSPVHSLIGGGGGELGEGFPSAEIVYV